MKQKRIVTTPILSLMVWILFLHKYVGAKKEEVYYGIVFNKRAPDFTLTSQNGTRVTLSRFRGELVLRRYNRRHRKGFEIAKNGDILEMVNLLEYTFALLILYA